MSSIRARTIPRVRVKIFSDRVASLTAMLYRRRNSDFLVQYMDAYSAEATDHSSNLQFKAADNLVTTFADIEKPLRDLYDYLLARKDDKNYNRSRQH